MKFLKKYPIILSVFFFTWIFLLWHSYNLFSEVKDFSTEGASQIIRMLEFTNYRSKELVIYFILYFILISLNILYLQVIGFDKNNHVKTIFIGINALIILASIFMSNIFWIVSIVLIVLAMIIIWSSKVIYKLFLDHSILYDSGDIIYSSDEFTDRLTAETELSNVVDKLSPTELKNNISYDIYEEDNKYYFYIQAKNTIKVNKKELF